jgi:hypothetical protein
LHPIIRLLSAVLVSCPARMDMLQCACIRHISFPTHQCCCWRLVIRLGRVGSIATGPNAVIRSCKVPSSKSWPMLVLLWLLLLLFGLTVAAQCTCDFQRLGNSLGHIGPGREVQTAQRTQAQHIFLLQASIRSHLSSELLYPAARASGFSAIFWNMTCRIFSRHF